MLNCVNAAHATHILGKGNLYSKGDYVYSVDDADDESSLIEMKKVL